MCVSACVSECLWFFLPMSQAFWNVPVPRTRARAWFSAGLGSATPPRRGEPAPGLGATGGSRWDWGQVSVLCPEGGAGEAGGSAVHRPWRRSWGTQALAVGGAGGLVEAQAACWASVLGCGQFLQGLGAGWGGPLPQAESRIRQGGGGCCFCPPLPSGARGQLSLSGAPLRLLSALGLRGDLSLPWKGH